MGYFKHLSILYDDTNIEKIKQIDKLMIENKQICLL